MEDPTGTRATPFALRWSHSEPLPASSVVSVAMLSQRKPATQPAPFVFPASVASAFDDRGDAPATSFTRLLGGAGLADDAPAVALPATTALPVNVTMEAGVETTERSIRHLVGRLGETVRGPPVPGDEPSDPPLSVALAFVGTDPAQQALLLHHLMLAGHYAAAKRAFLALAHRNYQARRTNPASGRAAGSGGEGDGSLLSDSMDAPDALRVATAFGGVTHPPVSAGPSLVHALAAAPVRLSRGGGGATPTAVAAAAAAASGGEPGRAPNGSQFDALTDALTPDVMIAGARRWAKQTAPAGDLEGAMEASDAAAAAPASGDAEVSEAPAGVSQTEALAPLSAEALSAARIGEWSWERLCRLARMAASGASGAAAVVAQLGGAASAEDGGGGGDEDGGESDGLAMLLSGEGGGAAAPSQFWSVPFAASDGPAAPAAAGAGSLRLPLWHVCNIAALTRFVDSAVTLMDACGRRGVDGAGFGCGLWRCALAAGLCPIGLDAEWRPDGLYDPLAVGDTAGARGVESAPVPVRWPVSVLQLCLPHGVALVDMLALHVARGSAAGGSNVTSTGSGGDAGAAGVREYDAQVVAQFARLFGHPRAVTLGLGLTGDRNKLAWSYPHWATAFEPRRFAASLESSALLAATRDYLLPAAVTAVPAAVGAGSSSAVAQARAAVLPHSTAAGVPSLQLQRLHVRRKLPPRHHWLEGAAQALSLTATVSACLGRPLNKRQQTSDWQLRPLSPAQVRYAALDAAALVAVWDRALSALVSELCACGAAGEGEHATLTELIRSACTTAGAAGDVADGEVAGEGVMRDVGSGGVLPAWLYCASAHAVARLGEIGGEVIAAAASPPVATGAVDAVPAAAASAAALPPLPGLPPHEAAHLLSPAHVAVVLRANGLDPSRCLLTVGTSATAVAGATSLGVPPSHIVKSLAFLMAGETPVIALVRGSAKVDVRKLAAATGAVRAKSRMATADECVATFGYLPGTFPPFGHRATLPTFIDRGLMELPPLDSADGMSAAAAPQADDDGSTVVFAGGGSVDVMLRISVRRLAAVTRGAVVDICADAPGSGGGAGGGSTVPPLPPVLPPPAKASAAAVAAAAVDAGASDEELARSPPPSIPRPRFIVDSMMGRLTRWLRVVGVDAEATMGAGAEGFMAAWREEHGEPAEAPPPPPPPSTRSGKPKAGAYGPGVNVYGRVHGMEPDVLIEWANRSGRVLITRDRKVMARRDWCPIWFTPYNDTPLQFEHLTTHFGITVRPEDLMSRCAKCNGLGYEHLNTEQAAARGDVPAKVLEKIRDFWRCRRCDKVYWEGPKFEDTRDKFVVLFEDTMAAESGSGAKAAGVPAYALAHGKGAVGGAGVA